MSEDVPKFLADLILVGKEHNDFSKKYSSWDKYLDDLNRYLRSDHQFSTGRGGEYDGLLQSSIECMFNDLKSLVANVPFNYEAAQTVRSLVANIQSVANWVSANAGGEAREKMYQTIEEQSAKSSDNFKLEISKAIRRAKKEESRKYKKVMAKQRKHLPRRIYLPEHFEYYRRLCVEYTQPTSAEKTFQHFNLVGSIEAFIRSARNRK